MSTPALADTLLVHGSFHSSDCWGDLPERLSQAGITAHVVALPGHTGRPHPALGVNMRLYANGVIHRAEEVGRPLLLVGHSMGGFVISAAAELRPDLFARMVYLSAFVPKMGRSSLATVPPTSALLRASLAFRPNGSVAMKTEPGKQVFYNRCDKQLQEQAVGRLCPQPVRPLFSTITVTPDRLGTVPKRYIETTDDNAVPVESQRVMQGHQTFESVESIDSDHSPFLSAPERLSQEIVRACSAPFSG
jgi:pimeloyl-ACP methyl ester carboxylesterase